MTLGRKCDKDKRLPDRDESVNVCKFCDLPKVGDTIKVWLAQPDEGIGRYHTIFWREWFPDGVKLLDSKVIQIYRTPKGSGVIKIRHVLQEGPDKGIVTTSALKFERQICMP